MEGQVKQVFYLTHSILIGYHSYTNQPVL